MDYFLGVLFFALIWGSVLAYVVLQLYALVRCKGWWRGTALVALLGMTPVVWITIIGYNEESNLWPIFLILASPVAVAYLAVLLLVHRFTQVRRTLEQPAAKLET
jgi:hypothetical protein